MMVRPQCLADHSMILITHNYHTQVLSYSYTLDQRHPSPSTVIPFTEVMAMLDCHASPKIAVQPNLAVYKYINFPMPLILSISFLYFLLCALHLLTSSTTFALEASALNINK